jgi:aminopeptidase-like protein
MIGEEILKFAKDLFPLNRSLTGDGVRETLRRISRHLPELRIYEVPSGTEAFDWRVPDEWEISEAYLEDPSGKRIVDFSGNNLHVVGYSTPVDETFTLDELQPHLHSLPEMPDAIPYVTSYYSDRWGFCVSHRLRQSLRPGSFRAVIKSRKFKGVMNYADLLIPGETKKEVLLSTYICHPSMANNEVSGPAVMTYIGKWLREYPRRYSYRLVFAPETIGAVYYLSKHLDHLRSNVLAGFNISCVGDDRNYSYVASRKGDTIADRIAQRALTALSQNYVRHSFLERQSDERQYGSALVDLPYVGLSRTKYGCYDEYHTSLDDFTVVTAAGLEGGFKMVASCINLLESSRIFVATHPGEPQLGKRGLYPTLGGGRVSASVDSLLNVLTYCDGKDDVLTIAEHCGLSEVETLEILEILDKHGLVREVDPRPQRT